MTTPPHKADLSSGRALYLAIVSMLMCFSVFLTGLAVYPLALLITVMGRQKGYLFLGGYLLVAIGLVLYGLGSVAAPLFVVFIAFAISEVIFRKIKPIKGIFITGTIVLATVFIGATSYYISTGENFEGTVATLIEQNQELIDQQKKQWETSASSESIELLALFDDPKLMAQKIIREAIPYTVVSIYLVVWMNLFLLLRSRRFIDLRGGLMGEIALVQMKLPDHLIWLVIGGLALLYFGAELGAWAYMTGGALLGGLGAFYFFQGFGIYLSFLSSMGIFGFFRTILVVVTVMMAPYILMIIGLLDMFINFRKFFTKKTN